MSLDMDASGIERFSVEQLLSDIRCKADQLMASDLEASEAGIPLSRDEDSEHHELSWNELQALMKKEREQASFQRSKGQFRDQIRQSLITKWIKEQTKVEDGFGQDMLRSTIEGFLRLDRPEELKVYLCDVLKSGKTIADNKRRRRHRTKNDWLTYSFVILRGLAYVGGVLAVFSMADSKFQRVTLAVLIMIGNMLLTNRSNDALYRTRLGTIIGAQFDVMRQFFKFPENESEREERMESTIVAERDLALHKTSIYIGFVFEAIVWLICITVLVSQRR